MIFFLTGDFNLAYLCFWMVVLFKDILIFLFPTEHFSGDEINCKSLYSAFCIGEKLLSVLMQSKLVKIQKKFDVI